MRRAGFWTICACLTLGNILFSPLEGMELNDPLVYLASGTKRLIQKEFAETLEHLEKAQQILRLGDGSEELPFSGMNFLITFEKAIAYDALGEPRKCEELLDLLFLMLRDDALQAEPGDTLSLSTRAMTVDFLSTLISLAPSIWTRDQLRAIVEDLTAEFTSFGLPSLSHLRRSSGHAQQTALFLQRCGFWKTCKKLLKDVKDVCAYVYQIIKTWNDCKKEWEKAFPPPEGGSNIAPKQPLQQPLANPWDSSFIGEVI